MYLHAILFAEVQQLTILIYIHIKVLTLQINLISKCGIFWLMILYLYKILRICWIWGFTVVCNTEHIALYTNQQPLICLAEWCMAKRKAHISVGKCFYRSWKSYNILGTCKYCNTELFKKEWKQVGVLKCVTSEEIWKKSFYSEYARILVKYYIIIGIFFLIKGLKCNVFGCKKIKSQPEKKVFKLFLEICHIIYYYYTTYVIH